jgi:soluble lytic murein transglycosylase-like protein
LANYGDILQREAQRRNVSVPLLIAVIAVESGGNPRAISPKGAGGLMQLMPGTARRFGVSNSLAPAQNIRGGAHYLDWLLRFFGDDAVLALAGYNAGEQAVETHLGVPPFSETRDYVAKVAGAYWVARQFCQTPPKGPREACALK